MSEEFVLQTEDLVKEFKGFVAVDNVNLSVRRGSIHALIGPNGAGKTTVFNLLTKFLTPTRGRIFYNGRDITKADPSAIAKLGMIRSFQISSVFPYMTALENVRLGLQAREKQDAFAFWRPGKTLNRLNDKAQELLDAVGLSQFTDTKAVELPYGRKRALEIATTLALDPALMLLDEPTQGMGTEDVDAIRDLLRKVAVGRTVLMVEHNLSVVSSLAHQITVLQRGAVLAEGDYATVSQNPEVISAYMGTAANG